MTASYRELAAVAGPIKAPVILDGEIAALRGGRPDLSERWRTGTVQRYDGKQVTVLFDEDGYRELFLPLVLQRGLLRPA